MRTAIFTAVIVSFAAGTCSAQVVTLPTFNTFQYSGSVLVPDGGAAHLGSIGRSAESRRSNGWGPFRSGPQTSGRSISRGTLSAHVQIIDLAEMDRQLLGAEPQEFLRRQCSSTASPRSGGGSKTIGSRCATVRAKGELPRRRLLLPSRDPRTAKRSG